MPDNVAFRTKRQIALDQLRAALAAGIEAQVALTDAGYGTDTDFRDGVSECGLPYVVGIQSSTSLWPPGAPPGVKEATSSLPRNLPPCGFGLSIANITAPRPDPRNGA